MPTPDELNARFAAPGVRFEAGRGGLAKAVLTRDGATAEVYLHGAHVTHYQPAGKPPALFLSEKAIFQPGKAIRGGVPICFPWFGDREGHPESPAHGFARTMEWVIAEASNEDGDPSITLRLTSNEQTRSLWPAEFEADFYLYLSDGLYLSLIVQNVGLADFVYEEAMHTYLAVEDVRAVAVSGLGGIGYKDKTEGFREKTQPEGPLKIEGETDRVYALPNSERREVTLKSQGRQINIGSDGSASTVLWNPWVEKAARMADFGDGEWQRMLCVETANVGAAAVTLEPGGVSFMVAMIETP